MTAFLPHKSPCSVAYFQSRYKRFTVEATNEQGETVLAHTNNTGSMTGLLQKNARALLSPANNPERKLQWTLEAIEYDNNWVGINTSTPNKLLKVAWEQKAIPELLGYTEYKGEVKVGNSRLDACLYAEDKTLWVECKNVTLAVDGKSLFPDAVTERGQKHLYELMELSKTTNVALFFLIQRIDTDSFSPAEHIDKKYATLLRQAVDCGVILLPYQALVTEEGITLQHKLSVIL